MNWNYRIVRYKDKNKGCGLHEIYYDEFGRPTAMSKDPVTFDGGTVVEIIGLLGMAHGDAMTRGVVNEEDVIEPQEKNSMSD